MMAESKNKNKNSDITNEEAGLIAQLKERVKDELPTPVLSYSDDDTDLYLVRWLRARDLNVEKATKMLRTHLEWRKERNADNAIDMIPHPFLTENYPFTYAGTDKFGQPVFLMPMGEWDFRKVVNNPDRLAEFDDFITSFYEIVCNHIREQHLKRKENGHGPITQMIMIFDVKNYSYMQLINFKAMKTVLNIAATYEAHYPEILFRAVFVNCPSFFGMFITMLKPVIATKTLGKITCYSQMPEWENDLQEFIDPAILPERYGGTQKKLP